MTLKAFFIQTLNSVRSGFPVLLDYIILLLSLCFQSAFDLALRRALFRYTNYTYRYLVMRSGKPQLKDF